MSGSERTAQRLFLEARLATGERVACTSEQANYLLNVLRLGANDEILVFNGRDGEWRARLADVGKRRCTLECVQLTRAQTAGPDIHYLFAPLKHARLDYMRLTSGISTGHTCSQRPQNVEACASSPASCAPNKAGDSTAPMGPA